MNAHVCVTYFYSRHKNDLQYLLVKTAFNFTVRWCLPWFLSILNSISIEAKNVTIQLFTQRYATWYFHFLKHWQMMGLFFFLMLKINERKLDIGCKIRSLDFNHYFNCSKIHTAQKFCDFNTVPSTIKECTNVTTPFYPICALLSVKWLLMED